MTGVVSAAFTLGVVGALVSLAGSLWMVFRAFRVSSTWGIACLMCSPAQLAFVVVHFREGWLPLLVQLVGTVLALVARVLIAVAVPPEAAPAAPLRLSHDDPPVERGYTPPPAQLEKDDDPGRLVLLSPVAATAVIDGATAPVPVEVALPPGFHEVEITDEVGQTVRYKVRIARRKATTICWNFPTANYCNAGQLAVADQRW